MTLKKRAISVGHEFELDTLELERLKPQFGGEDRRQGAQQVLYGRLEHTQIVQRRGKPNGGVHARIVSVSDAAGPEAGLVRFGMLKKSVNGGRWQKVIPYNLRSKRRSEQHAIRLRCLVRTGRHDE